MADEKKKATTSKICGKKMDDKTACILPKGHTPENEHITVFGRKFYDAVKPDEPPQPVGEK